MNSPRRGYSTQEETYQSLYYAGILDIPNEVMDNITNSLNDWDFANFRATTRCVHTVTLDAWYKRVLADKEGLPPLIWAAKFNKPSLITILLTKFPSIDGNMDQRASKESSPLTIASCSGSEEAVKALCANGADINYENHEMHRPSALLCAARTHQFRTVQTLLKLGANANALSRKGSTVLHYAAKTGQYETLKVLLEWRRVHPDSMPDIDRCDAKGRTALELTYSYRGEGSNRIIMSVGDTGSGETDIASPPPEPDFAVPMRWPIGALDLNNRGLIAAYVVHHWSLMADGPAPTPNRNSVVEEILSAGTPVSLSFEDPTLSLAKLLIDHGAAFDKATVIPSLHAAFRDRDLELAHLILYAGGDVNRIDEQGLAAIHILTTQSYSGYIFIALIYLEVMGADMFLRNGAGKTPVELAVASNWPTYIIETFLFH